MAVFSDSGILEVIAVTLAVVIMLGPLVPYAIIGRRARQRAGGLYPARFLMISCPSGFAFSL